jgi:hypothetical protein
MTDPLAADRLARLPGPTPFLLLDLDRVATAYLGFATELPGVDVHYTDMYTTSPACTVIVRSQGRVWPDGRSWPCGVVSARFASVRGRIDGPPNCDAW